jgi:hypothetical protein
MTTQPMTTAPMTTAPMTTAPMTTQPMTTAPMTTAPMMTQAMTTQPMTTQPMMTQQIITQRPQIPELPTNSTITFKIRPNSNTIIDGNIFINGSRIDLPKNYNTILDQEVLDENNRKVNLLIKTSFENNIFQYYYALTDPSGILEPGKEINFYTTEIPSTMVQPTTRPFILPTNTPMAKPTDRMTPHVSSKKDEDNNKVVVPNGRQPIVIDVSYNSNNPKTLNDYTKTKNLADYFFDTGI